jgi:hypothetical protein
MDIGKDMVAMFTGAMTPEEVLASHRPAPRRHGEDRQRPGVGGVTKFVW